MEEGVTRRCSHKGCSGTFDMKPPPDLRYRYAKAEPESKDHIWKVYRCTNKHGIMVFWEPEPPSVGD